MEHLLRYLYGEGALMC